MPDLHAELLRSASSDDTTWAEWDWHGTRRDGQPHHMRGVTILGVRGDRADWVRFYMEPVDQAGPAIDGAIRQLVATDRADR